MPQEATKAVVLARGLGTRMRRDDKAAILTAEQARAADAGLKGMIPIGRPFLDYVLSGLADAGYRHACLVIGPEHGAVRDHYEKLAPSRLDVAFAVQERPLGTADAVLAAEDFAAGDPFLVINSDNYYPVEACRALRTVGCPGLAAFEKTALVEGGIDPGRVGQFAVVVADRSGRLERILEKPGENAMSAMAGEVFVSMNCWLFGPSIFAACRQIEPSVRGELELPAAVQHAVDVLGESFRVLPFRAAVLDLSRRSDVGKVAERLRSVEVRL
jgi:dTDP-glucose pyrophosphorylase